MVYMEKIRNLMKKESFVNSCLSLGAKMIAMIFYMALDILIARKLDIDGYAEWVFFFAISTMLFYFGWFGINTSAKVYISKQQNKRSQNNTIAAALVLRLIVSALVTVLIMVFSQKASYLLGYPDKYKDLKTLLFGAAWMVFFNSISEFYKELCIGKKFYKQLFALTVVEYMGYFLWTLAFLLYKQRPESVLMGYIVSGVCVSIIGLYYLKHKFEFKVTDIDDRWKENIQQIMKYALPIALISLGGLVLVEMDTFMLGILSTKEQVSIYSIAKQLCSKATHINYAIVVGTMTSFSVIKRENVQEKKKKFYKISKINFAITLLIAILFWAFTKLIIGLLYGNQYLGAGNVIKMLLPYYILYGVSNYYASFLDFQQKAKFRSVCYISIIVINLALNWLFIPQYGAYGAAVATSISLIPYTICVIWGTRRVFKNLISGKNEE